MDRGLGGERERESERVRVSIDEGRFFFTSLFSPLENRFRFGGGDFSGTIYKKK